MPKKPGKLSPQKDSNGGKLGQFTTEVSKTIKKAKEESAAFFLGEIKRIEAFHNLEMERMREESNQNTYFDGVIHTSLIWGGIIAVFYITHVLSV